MARRIEKEHRGKIARFKKIIQNLDWQVRRDQEETLKVNLGSLGASKIKRMIFLDPNDDRVEDRRSMEKELCPILEDLSINLSLNPSFLCYEVSLEELKSLLDSYNLQISLIGDMCIIAFEGNLFLLGPSTINYISSHFSLEDPLMSGSAIFDPSCYGFGNLNDTSLVELNIAGFALEFDRNSL
ncbi:hypothetical protein M9H77_30556 [Catharanthus roseus]|uniref:Uncharacterized protein n=1 Tax=Catharanthus roseus TaxID=4058 RepID=A0ACB9ZZM3_CATRO|nr:hypothetical protein M9H77_30556 [Catharanthus roseus]